MRRLRVLVLMHEYLVPPDSIEGLSEKEIAPWKMEYDVLWALGQLGHEVRALGLGTELRPIREAIEEFEPHIAVNLLVYFQDIGYYDAHVISYLELQHLPYTGCNPRGLLIASDKALSKKILAWHRIPVPAFAVFRRGRRVHRPKRLDFPLFVKSVNEHASQGIAQASIVHDDLSLTERVEFIHRKVGTDAIAEAYIEGRELTVGVIGNQRLTACPTWEMTFKSLPAGSEPIATSRVKWDHAYQEKIGLTTGPAAELPGDLERKLPRMAKRIFRALDLSGYARIDLRMDAAGQVYVLEANPNPDITFGEDFAEAAELAGLTYPELIQRILNLGLSYAPAWKAT